MLSKGLGRHFPPDEKDRLFQDAKNISASSLSSMASHDLPLLGQPCLPTSSCFFVRLTTRRFFVPA